MIATETYPEILGPQSISFYKLNNWFENIFKNRGTSDVDDVEQPKMRSLSSIDCFPKACTYENPTHTDDKKEFFIINNLYEKLDVLEKYGIDWSDEDISIGPNESVLKTIRGLIPKLVRNDLIPFRIAPSIDEGACVVFQKESIIVYLEFYNDGDIGLISENYTEKKIIENIDLTEHDVISNLERILS